NVSPTPDLLVDSTWLAAHLGEVTVVDCRYVLDRPGAGRAAYLEGHIPGAGFLDLEVDLSGERSDTPGALGRHPLPSAEHFAAAARRAGIRRHRPVVAYDQGVGGGGARLWWLLRHFGKLDAGVLRGGIPVWRGPLERGERDAAPGDFEPRERFDDTIDAAGIQASSRRAGVTLVDVRPAERHRRRPHPT